MGLQQAIVEWKELKCGKGLKPLLLTYYRNIVGAYLINKRK